MGSTATNPGADSQAMFEPLDDSCFDDVPSAYGSAEGAPERLRALADEDPHVAYEALYWIQADYFHQDLFDEATPLVVPYLLEVVQAPLPVQSDVLELLGRMLRGGTYAADDLAPYVPRADARHRDELGSSVAPDTHETRTRQAIEAGEPVLAALLDAPDPEVRGMAMWTYAAFGPPARARIEARLAIEPDARVRICARLALSTLGATPIPIDREDDADGIAEADVVAVLEASVPIDEATERAFLRLLDAPELPWLRFKRRRADAIALHHLRRLGPAEPRLVPLLERVLEAADDPFGEIAQLAREVLFPAGVPRHARELSEAQRWAFRRVWVGEARGVKLDFGDLAGQRAFVDGDGPLDDVVTFRGHTGTVAEQLLAHPDEAEALLASHIRDLPEARVFELATSITRGDLGYRAFWDAAIRTCAGSVTLERTLAYLEALPRRASEATSLTEADAQLLLAPYLEPPRPPPEALDPIAIRWMNIGRPALRDWVRTFPPPRRAALVAKLGGEMIALSSICDRRLLGEEVLARFVASPRGETAELAQVPSSLLRARAPSLSDADKRAHIEEVLAEREARTKLALSARKIHVMELELMMPNGTRLAQLELDRLRAAADLEPILEVLRESPHAVLTVYASVPAWIVDAVGDELGDRVELAK